MISPEVVTEKALQGLAKNTPEIRVEKAQLIYYLSRFVPQLGFRPNRLSTSN